MEHNSDILELLVDNKHRTKQFMDFLMPILFVFALFAVFAGGSGNLNFPSSSSSTTSSKFNTLIGRFTEKYKVDLKSDNEIILLIEKLIKNNLPFIFRFGKN